jgi:hypothetical protein
MEFVVLLFVLYAFSLCKEYINYAIFDSFL